MCLLSRLNVAAVEFVIADPRAMGMGGAGVAVTTDALATYWNPAGLAMKKSFDLRVQASGQVIDRNGFADTIRDVKNIDKSDTSPANQAKLQDLLDQLNRESISAAAAGGVYLKGYLGDHAFGFNVSDVATAGSFLPAPATATVDTTVVPNVLIVNGQLAVRGLEARQAGFSYAHAFVDRTFSLGATIKIIQGAAYSGQVNITGSKGDSGFTRDLGKPKISTGLGIDVGAIYRPSSWLRFGIVGKDLNQPSFDAPGGGEFKLLPQVRGGVAVNPYSSLTLTFDGDISSNKTLLPDVKSRVLSLGAEQTFLSEFLSVRAGALKNVNDASSAITPTAGLGVRIFALRLDIGGGYDFRKRQALVSGLVAMTF